jgi:predicted permease
MQRFWQDIRYAMRVMRKKPAFAVFAILTLALGIGVNTVVFSIANAILLRPIPATEPDRLIRIYQRTAEGSVQQRFSYPDYKDLSDGTSLLEGIAAVSLAPFRLESGDHSEQILGEAVSGNYFSLLGVQALHGRVISEADDQSGSRSVVLLSQRFWEQRFENNSSVNGQTIRLNGKVFDVIGVMDSKFTGTFAGARIDAWIPLLNSQSMMESDWQNDRGKMSVHLMARLKPDVSIDQVNAELGSVFSRLEKAYPDTNRGKRIFSTPATLLHGNLRKGASIFFAAVMVLMAVVLLIACSNLASLLVTRAMERSREMAIRISLGANRKLLAQQLFTESFLFAVLGGVAGLAVAVWTSQLIITFWPVPTVPIHFDFQPDVRVFLFCFGLTVLTGVLLGLAPVLQGNRQDLVSALKQDSGSSFFSRMRLKNVLLTAQISLSLILLICAALFVQSWQNAEQLDPGFNPQNMLAMDINVAEKGFTKEQGVLYYEQLAQRVQNLPGVVSVALTDLAPVDLATARTPVRIAGHAPPAGQDALLISSNRISPGYFETTQMQLLRGRDFQEQDDANAKPVVIINETMARRYWQNEDPIGKSFQIGEGFVSGAIVGIAKDAKYRTPGEEPTPHMYLPYEQFYEPGLSLLIRTQQNPKSLVHPIEREMSLLDSNIQAFFARSMEEHLAFSFLPVRLGGSLLGFFGLLGLLLACIGIYAAISFQVAQRKREIGIRMAIGARPQRILQLFVQRGLKLSLIGSAIGMVGSFAVTQLLSSLLIGVGTHDPITFVLVPLSLILVSFFASALPAYRASRLDPLKSLRYE